MPTSISQHEIVPLLKVSPLLGVNGNNLVKMEVKTGGWIKTHGRSLWLMHGLFRANGGCGYVKKPVLLLENGLGDKVFDPRSKLPVKMILKVKVYMKDGWHLDFIRTHFDIYSPPDFYVKIGIVGVQTDSVMKKTKVALLRVEVHEYDMTEKDDFGGQTCLPISELQSGIQAVTLHDPKGNNSVKLLMGFRFE